MKKYKCPLCNSTFLEIDLLKTKVSENAVETYISEYCPKCLNKKRLVHVYELEENNND